jgi:hypothetical protein
MVHDNNISRRLVILPKQQALHTKMSKGRIGRVKKSCKVVGIRNTSSE